MARFFDRDRLPVPIVIRFTVVLLLWVLVYHVLVTFRLLLYPLVLGFLFAFLLHPIAGRLERLRVPRIAANLLAIFIGIGIIYGMILFLRRQLGVVLADMPNLRAQAATNVQALYETLRNGLGLPLPEGENVRLSRILQAALDLGGEGLRNTFRGTANTIYAIGILPVYVFMFLYYRDKFRRFILMLVPERDHRLAARITRRIAAVTGRYMTGIFAVVLILSVINSTGFIIIGLKYPILLGITAAICTFLPYFGNIVGYSIAFLFALIASNAPDKAVWVVLQFIIVQFVENNILAPNIVGGMVRVNPFFVILGVLVGGMIWGIPGMFVSIPLLGMLKVTCDVIPSLRPWSFLISDRGTEVHALTASKIRRFFAFSRLARASEMNGNDDEEEDDAA